MMAKIEWYQEILEQEPASRTFLPLAKLLIEAGRKEEAAITLRRGLERHPDFLEAKLEFISLLHAQKAAQPDCVAECASEIGKLIGVLKQYPAFWEAWAESEEESDAALAIRFLRQAIDAPGLAFRDILARGLGETARGASECSRSEAKPAPHEAHEETIFPASPAVNMSDRAFSLPRSVDVSGDPAPVSSAAGDEGHVTLRTRSMAEVLAEQGDIAGALEIYQELEAAAPTPEEAAVLRERVMTLASRLNEQPDSGAREKREAGTSDPDTVDEAAEPAQAPGGGDSSQKTMLHLLEKLADRLEARARV